ncbi:uncharacterized protein LOC110454745 [Mizuhopecten yessoensis]|uniref:Schlafen AlbA-2 domain-containing protein n=1 Tax=Mizuhopecten yessoensis TaxID=6573 RepID=A0A210QEH2_MIZYE|nr:uncharacterized protein LOC110454745 [Mizuhopecten yessoensis]OWF47152.1 hypothetical protein KP79_PYT13499 [Mizuhopecten yessoensis]
MTDTEISPSKSKVHLYYKNGSLMPFEEDAYHEFKGHRDISKEDCPPWTQDRRSCDRPSRRAVSRALNAFLNTGRGGTCYLGVVDSGEVKGLKLTEYQKDHVVSSLDDLMSRYTPPVKQHRYKIRFVPVVDQDATEEEIIQHCSQVNSDLSVIEERQRPHQLRSHTYCWCDRDSVAQFNCGVLPTDYVIEITIKPWDGSDPRNHDDGCGSFVCLHPYHEDEEGCVYFRRQASLVKYTMTEIAMLTKQEARENCEATIKSLREEISLLKVAQQKAGDG